MDRKKQPSNPLGDSLSENKMEKMAKIFDSLTAEMWKLNPVIEQFYSQQLSIDHAKSLTKDDSLEFDSNIVASQKVKGKMDRKKQPSDPLMLQCIIHSSNASASSMPVITEMQRLGTIYSMGMTTSFP